MSDVPVNPESPPNDDDLGIRPGEKLCGNCRLFKPVLKDASGWKGDCRIQPDRGMFPPSAPVCGSYMARSAPLPRAMPVATIDRPRAARAPIVRPVRERNDAPIPELENMTREELKEIIREALSESDVRLAPKWEGGTVVIKPASGELQPKELPIDALFHKVVMVRDRLRVLEQKVNGHPKLSDAEKVEMQQYVTRCYGSLTSFNLLFADKNDYFVGEKGKGE